jgi:hypothetical protein
MFGIVIAVAVKSVFRLKCIKMMSFHIFKIIFDINASKQFKNTKKILILSKKKFQSFWNAGSKRALSPRSLASFSKRSLVVNLFNLTFN